MNSYLDSAWTANFGVVPLFLFFAFRFWPIFFFFLARLTSVLRVKETIQHLLARLGQPKFILYGAMAVNLGLYPIISSGYEGFSLTLQKDSQHLIARKKVAHYARGNNQIIGVHVSAQGVLVKAKKLGTTDLKIWSQNGPETFTITILSKKEFQRFIWIKDQATQLGLEFNQSLQHPQYLGELKRIEDYHELKKISDSLPLDLSKIILSKELTKEIFAKFYLYFFNNFFDYIRCEFSGVFLNCSHPYENKKFNELAKRAGENFFVRFTKRVRVNNSQNYLIRIKLFSLEDAQGKEVRFGIDALDIPIKDLLNSPLSLIKENHQAILKENQLELSTLSDHRAFIQLDREAFFRFGQQIPYRTIDDQNRSVTQWRFAGLLLKIKLAHNGTNHSLQYSTSLSSPSPEGESIQDSQQKSQIFLTLKSPVKLFEFDILTEGKEKNQIPVLGDLPVLGYFFSSRTHQRSYKKIIGLAEISNQDLPK